MDELLKSFGFNKKGQLLIKKLAGRDHMKEATTLQELLKEEGVRTKLNMDNPLGVTVEKI